MLDATSILALESRIGFGSTEIAIPVEPHHRLGASGRTLPAFHKLANLKNIYNTAEKAGMTIEEFDGFLTQMKRDAVMSAVNDVFNLNPKYILGTDYSFVVDKYPALFDNAIGFTLAVAAIEMAVSTNRENDQERNARLTYDKLKIELEGLKDAYGGVISNGLKRSQYFAIKKTAEILFPKNLIIEAPKVW